jgi:hypothetical protein
MKSPRGTVGRARRDRIKSTYIRGEFNMKEIRNQNREK